MPILIESESMPTERKKSSVKSLPIPQVIGPYRILRRLGQGGMGDVLLGEDPHCPRMVAIKRVRPDLAKHDLIRDRFLKEAKITASLCHPSIMPIYTIHQSEEELYYVMPFVEGETLKKILKDTIQKESLGESPHPIGASITSLTQIFLNICQAVSYCHSRGILHRDLKPENILVGNFGQVLIFDWGLAGYMNEPTSLELDLPVPQDPHLTRPGKILGTLHYMPPERVYGKPADIHTDIYSLGVILYQLLTLRMPFVRSTIQEYKKNQPFELPKDAIEVAPQRDIPPPLSLIANKCLAPEVKDRYQNVKEILADLEHYNLGLPDWTFAADLKVDRTSDWEIQENVLLSKLIPITRSTEIMQWHILMISRRSFSGNKRIEARVRLDADSEGIGFLLNVPEPKERECLEDGYTVWIGSLKNPGIRLLRSNVAIFDLSESYLEKEKTYKIAIEKIDQTVRLFIDGALIFNYIDTLPIVGTHVGLLCKDMEFTLETYKIFVGSQNATVDCLSIPDAFLASKNFDKALSEYERIASSFSGRIQGREAIFRSGITFIEKGKFVLSEFQKKQCLKAALSKFDLLHATPSAPLEYFGKSLVYRKLGDLDEELKCLELGLRRFIKHPLAPRLEERVLFRLHESAKTDRIGVYNFALLTLRHLPHQLANRETHALIHNLSTHSEKLYFLKEPKPYQNLKQLYRYMAIQIAFWLDRPLVLQDMYESEEEGPLKELLSSALIELGYEKPSFMTLDKIVEKGSSLSPKEFRDSLFWLERLLSKEKSSEAITHAEALRKLEPEESVKHHLDHILVWGYLLQNETGKAYALLEHYLEEISTPTSPFHMLFGCYLTATKGLESGVEHFKKVEDYTFPPLYALLGQKLKGKEAFYERWSKQSFFWEKLSLRRQEALFYHTLGKKRIALYHEKELKSFFTLSPLREPCI